VGHRRHVGASATLKSELSPEARFDQEASFASLLGSPGRAPT